jgi:type I restriction-modification system DNA methylase subunit
MKTRTLDMIGSIKAGDGEDRHTLGRVYEYFLARFANAEGGDVGDVQLTRGPGVA